MLPGMLRSLLAVLVLLSSVAPSWACSDRSSGGKDAGAAPAGTGASGSSGSEAAGGSAGTRPGAVDAGTAGSAAGSGAGVGGGGVGAVGGSGGNAAFDAGGAAQGGDGGMTTAGSDGGAGVMSGTPFVYISGYGANIHVFELDPDTGALDERGTADGGDGPSYLAIAPDRRTLYAINEGGGTSRVIAFAIDAATGALREINSAATGGQGAPHLAVHPSGKWVAVAHYGSGHISVLPVRADGGVEPVVASVRGPGDSCMRAHQCVFDRSGAYLFVPCLQSNFVLAMRFDAANGSLSYNEPATVAVTGGPRHMAFDPAERRAYVLSELASTITWFAYDAATGRLSAPQVIDSAQATKGASAHIAVHPSGRFLYASNRSENSLAAFVLDADGRPSTPSFTTDMIAMPRDFTVDPSGTFLISANQAGPENALVFRINAQTGALTRVQTVAVGDRPTFVGVVMLPAPAP